MNMMNGLPYTVSRRSRFGPNLFHENVASATNQLNNITGFDKVMAGDALESSTSESYILNRSLKVTTPGSTIIEGVYLNLNPSQVPVSTSTIYNMIIRIKGTSGHTLRILPANGAGGLAATNFTLTGGWDKINLTGTFTNTTTNITVRNGIQANTVWYVGKCELRRVVP